MRRGRRRRCRTTVLAVVLAAGLDCLAQAPAAADRLDDLDTSFVPAYEARMSTLGAMHPPYVEASGDSLFLHLHGREPVKARFLTESYDHLKDVAHVPFTVYLLLVGLSATTLSDSQMAPLRAFLGKIMAAEEGLPSAGFDSQQIGRQKQMLDASKSILDRTLANRKAEQEAVQRFSRAMGPLTLQNADEAGCLRVQAIHAQMMRWKPLMTPQEWQAFDVVIRSSHQPRYRNVATQYFGWLLGGSSPSWAFPGESSRVIYAETLLPNQTGGDELLSVHVDFEAGQAFFGDKWRMSEDLLSGGAARCVGQLSPSDRAWKLP